MIIEIWKQIVGYEGIYEVSNLGIIRSVERPMMSRWGKPYLKEGQVLTKRYFSNRRVSGWGKVILYDSQGKTKSFLASRLVAMAFIPNPENKPQVNHKDGDKTNDAVSNLEWATNKENCFHRTKVLGKSTREQHGKSKLKSEQIYLIRLLRNSGLAYHVIGEMFGVRAPSIMQIIKGEIWRGVGEFHDLSLSRSLAIPLYQR